jgi:hypothetical protein
MRNVSIAIQIHVWAVGLPQNEPKSLTVQNDNILRQYVKTTRYNHNGNVCFISVVNVGTIIRI